MGRRRKGGGHRGNPGADQGSDLQCPAGISTKTTYTWLEAKNRGAKEYMRVLQSRKQELQNLDLTDAFVERAEWKSLVSAMNDISNEEDECIQSSDDVASDEDAVPFPETIHTTVKTTKSPSIIVADDIGKRCRVVGYDVAGTIRFAGALTHSGVYKVGVELDAPKGLNNGTVQGTSYFTTTGDGPRGVFVHQRKVKITDDVVVHSKESDGEQADTDLETKPLDDSGVWQSPAPQAESSPEPTRASITGPVFDDQPASESSPTGALSAATNTTSKTSYTNLAHIPPAARLLHTMGLSVGMIDALRVKSPTDDAVPDEDSGRVLPEDIDDICDDSIDGPCGSDGAKFVPDVAPHGMSTPVGSPASIRHGETTAANSKRATTHAVDVTTGCSGDAAAEQNGTDTTAADVHLEQETTCLAEGSSESVVGRNASDDSAPACEVVGSGSSEKHSCNITETNSAVVPVVATDHSDVISEGKGVTVGGADIVRSDDLTNTFSGKNTTPESDAEINPMTISDVQRPSNTPSQCATSSEGAVPPTEALPSSVPAAQPASTHRCIGWDRDDICSWLEENSLDRFEDAVEDWDGTTVYQLAHSAAQDSAAIDTALDSVFAVMGGRDRRRAIKAWVGALAALLDPHAGDGADTSTPQERTPLGYASTYTPLHQRSADDIGTASTRDWAPPRVDYKEISRQLALERHKKALVQANISSNTDSADSVSLDAAADGSVAGALAEPAADGADRAGEASDAASPSAASTPSMDYREVSRLYALERHKKALLRAGRALTSSAGGGRSGGRGDSTTAAPSEQPGVTTVEQADDNTTAVTRTAVGETLDVLPDNRRDVQHAYPRGDTLRPHPGEHTQDVMLSLNAGDGETVTIKNRLFAQVDATTARVVPTWLVAQYGRQTRGMSVAHGILEDLGALAGFNGLRSLKIDKNGLTSLSTLPLLPALEELDVTGNPIGNVKHELVHLGTVVPRLQVLTLGVTTDPLDMIAASQTLPCLRLLDGREVAADVPIMWRLPVAVWDAVSRHLSARDVITFASSCKTARAIAKEMRRSAPMVIPRHIDAVTAGRWLTRWPALRFVYEHRGPASGLMVDELVGVHQLRVVGASDMHAVKHLAPRISTVCRSVLFERCDKLRDLAGLEMVDHVTLTACPGIDRVHMLNELQSLSITDCANVSTNDILYQLDDVPRLTLRNFPTIGAVGQLGGTVVTHTDTIRNQVRHWRRTALTMESFPKLRELRGLGTVYNLTLRDCPSITDVAPLRNVHTITLDNCPRLRDISPLTTCQVVTLENLQRVDCVRALANAQQVTLKNCPSISTVSALGNVPRVHIEACDGVRSVSLSSNARVATVVNCIALTTVSWTSEPAVPSLAGSTTRCITIDDCPALVDVAGIDGVTFVHLRRLTTPVDLAGLTHCTALYLTECTRVSGTEALQATPHPPHLSIDADSVMESGSPADTVKLPDTVPMHAQRAGRILPTRRGNAEVEEVDGNADTNVEDHVGSAHDEASADVEVTSITTQVTAQGSAATAGNTQPQEPKSDAGSFFSTLFGGHTDGKNPIAQWFNSITSEAAKTLMKTTGKRVESAPGALPPNDTAPSTPPPADQQPADDNQPSKSTQSPAPQPSDPKLDHNPPASEPKVHTTPQATAEPVGQPVSVAALTAAGRFASMSQTTLLGSAATHSWSAGTAEQSELQSAENLLAMEQARCELEEEAAFTVFSDLGHDARKQGEFSTALSFFFKALTVARSRKGESSSDVANIYVNLGIVYGSMKDHTKEMEYFRKALPVFQMVLGPKHQHVAMTLNNLGIANRNAGEYTRSMMYFNKALAIYCETLGDSHSETVRTQRNIDRLVRIARSKR